MEHLASPVFFLEFLLSFMKFTVTLFFIENICVFLLQGHVIIFLILIRRIYHSNIIYFTFYILYLYFRTNIMVDLIILQIPDQVPQTNGSNLPFDKNRRFKPSIIFSYSNPNQLIRSRIINTF